MTEDEMAGWHHRLDGLRPQGPCSFAESLRPALSLGGQATAWECSPGRPWTVARQALLSMGILQARTLEWVAM